MAIMGLVASIDDIVKEMVTGSEIRFADLFKVCEHYFGSPRNTGGSHYIFKMPWPGDPRVNIQDDKGRAKKYQVRQVLAAIAKLHAHRAEAAKKAAEMKNDPPKTEPPKKKK